MTKHITLRELSEEAGVDPRTLRRYVARGMPCEQIGTKATERGSISTPYRFDKQSALDWIATFRADADARLSSPFIEKLTREDPRYDAAVTATQRTEAKVQEILDTYTPRMVIADVTREHFDFVRHQLLKIPGDLAPAIARLTGKDGGKIEAALREEISGTLEGLRVDRVFADAVPLRPAPPEPSLRDELDEDDDIPNARRYASSDPRYALVQARTTRSQLELAIDRGVLLPTEDTAMAQGLILGEMNSLLRSVGGSIAQRMSSGRAEVAREVKDMIDRAVFETYARINAVSEIDSDEQEDEL